jgi:hypothetical protein
MAEKSTAVPASAVGHGLEESVEGKLVQFVADVFPHVKGEVKKVSAEELKRVDAVAKERGLDRAYEEVKAEAKKA